MRLMPLLLTIFLLFCLNTVGLAQNDENASDTLLLQMAKATADNRVAVAINFFNDQPLAALTIPLRVVSEGFTIDTVIFADSRVNYLRIRPVTITEDRKGVVFGAICMTEAYIPAGHGLLATMYLKPSGSEMVKECAIDTTTIDPANTLFTKPDSKSFVPVVKMGKIAISKPEPAPAPDSTKKQ